MVDRWYNSYNYRYMEGESMRLMYEPWFVKYKVDVVFAGHVHAYKCTVSGLNNSVCISSMCFTLLLRITPQSLTPDTEPSSLIAA
jgi:hypothetical protein